MNINTTIKKGMVHWKIHGIPVNTTIKSHAANYSDCASRNVSYVVMHYTGNPKDLAKSNATYFKNGSRSASAHFFVDDSEIYQSVELRDIAWHCGCPQGYKTSCRNSNSIGIEMCCTAGNYKVSEKTKEHAAYLCSQVCKLLGIGYKQVNTYVLRHYDVVKSNKPCPAQFVANSKEWKEFRTSVSNILRYGTVKKPSAAGKISTIKKKITLPKIAKPTLRTGSQGAQVSLLQKDLKHLGFKGKDGKKLTIDKDFGSNTAHALLSFQKKNKLEADGIYGNRSYAKMKIKIK